MGYRHDNTISGQSGQQESAVPTGAELAPLTSPNAPFGTNIRMT
jgi:hypothetical protein